MVRRLHERMTYANVTATIALFIVLGGTSYAAVTLPRNSVDATHIKSGAVRSSEVKDLSLDVKDLSAKARAALRGQAGPAGAQGPAGPQGPAGAQGGPGPAAAALAVKQVTGAVGAAPSVDETTVAGGSASCDAGQRVVAGGVRVDAPGSTAVQDSYPSAAGEWTARVGNDDVAAGHTFTVYAICIP
jgi:hypothetical protein